MGSTTSHKKKRASCLCSSKQYDVLLTFNIGTSFLTCLNYGKIHLLDRVSLGNGRVGLKYGNSYKVREVWQPYLGPYAARPVYTD